MQLLGQGGRVKGKCDIEEGKAVISCLKSLLQTHSLRAFLEEDVLSSSELEAVKQGLVKGQWRRLRG